MEKIQGFGSGAMNWENLAQVKAFASVVDETDKICREIVCH